MTKSKEALKGRDRHEKPAEKPVQGLVERTRKKVEKTPKISRAEKRWLQEMGAETFEEAMKDEIIFMTFFTDFEGIQEIFEPQRFAEMLIIAATSTPDNAKTFLQIVRQMKKDRIAVKDPEALKAAAQAARQMLKG